MAKKKYFLEDKYISVLRFIATGCNAKEFLFTWNQAFSYQCIMYMIFFNLANKVWGNIKQMFFPTLKKKKKWNQHTACFLPHGGFKACYSGLLVSPHWIPEQSVRKWREDWYVTNSYLWSTVWILSVVMVYSSCSNLSFRC